MKTLVNQTLLYDVDCPLCRVYTKGFISAGMLDKDGKKPYTELSHKEILFIDINRASNEIALVDNINKTVVYGIDSLLKVIGFSFPWVEKFGNWKIINLFLRKCYSFISYNRKVIAPCKINHEFKLQCIPDFSFKYRFLYISFAIICATLVFNKFSILMHSVPRSLPVFEFILVVGQVFFQSLFLLNFDKKTIVNYVGNLMTIALIGSLFLIPIVVLCSSGLVSETVFFAYLGSAVLLVSLEHYRRLKILELPSFLSFSFILYWLIALFIILILK